MCVFTFGSALDGMQTSTEGSRAFHCFYDKPWPVSAKSGSENVRLANKLCKQ